MNRFSYLVCLRDHPLKLKGGNGGAEVASLALAQHLAKRGRRVVLAAQLDGPEQIVGDVEYWDLGPSYNTFHALERASAEGDFILISAGKAQPLVEAGRMSRCKGRILVNHDRSGHDSGLKANVVSQHCNAIVCVSNACRDVMLEAGADPIKCTVINNGVDLTVFLPGAVKSRNPFRLVFAGALVQDKGIHYLIQAFAELKAKYPKICLDVFGSSGLWGRTPFFDADSIQRQLPGICFHGDVSTARLAEEFKTAGVLVYPSIWFEPFGMSATDALATGCPVVMFDVGGPRDIVIDGKNGVLIKDVSIQALTQALDGLLSNPQKLSDMSEWILANDRGRFDWNKVAAAFEQIAERLISSAAKGSDASEVTIPAPDWNVVANWVFNSPDPVAPSPPIQAPLPTAFKNHQNPKASVAKEQKEANSQIDSALRLML